MSYVSKIQDYIRHVWGIHILLSQPQTLMTKEPTKMAYIPTYMYLQQPTSSVFLFLLYDLTKKRDRLEHKGPNSI